MSLQRELFSLYLVKLVVKNSDVEWFIWLDSVNCELDLMNPKWSYPNIKEY